MKGGWVTPLRELYKYFVQSDTEFELLREIDRSAADLETPLAETIASVGSGLGSLAGASNGHIYAFDGEVLHHASSLGAPPRLKRLRPEELGLSAREGSRWEVGVKVVAELDTETQAAFSDSTALGEVPLLALGGEPRGLMLLESTEPPETSALLHDPRLHQSLEAVATQLSNAIALREHSQSVEKIARLVNEFFKHALNPLVCFKVLAHSASTFLPDFGPLKIDPAPEVQILLYDEQRRVLRIVGTTGVEPPVTRVSVGGSFVGTLVEEPDRSHKVDDPRKDKNYKSYLGVDKNKEMKSELAVPLVWEKNLIGVLNLESEHENAFRKCHIDAMIRLCAEDAGEPGQATIAPMIYALAKSILLDRSQQLSLVSALGTHLDNLGSVLRHGTATPQSTIFGKLSLLQEELQDLAPGLVEAVSEVGNEFDKLMGYVERYREDIQGFSHFGAHSIRGLLERAIELLKPKQLEEKRGIRVWLEPGEDVEVYTSLLLIQHVFDLLQNSVASVAERMAREPGHAGEIRLVAALEKVKSDKQEQKLNTRCCVTICDNGMGVPGKLLRRVEEPGFTTRSKQGGTGYGVFGARRFVEASNGFWMPPKNLEGGGFQVGFLLEEYNPDIHEDTVPAVGGSGIHELK